MANTIYDFATSEASSSATGGVNTAENQDPSTVNDAMRAWKQLEAKFIDDLGGVNTVGGTGDAITLTLAQGFDGYGASAGQIASGVVAIFKAAAANTGAVTLAVNSLATKAIRKIVGGTDIALSAGDLLIGGRYVLIYDSTANAAAGAWILVNPSLLTLESTDAGAAAGPDLALNRNSPTPAAADLGGRLLFQGEDSAGNTETYGAIASRIDDPTSTSEDGTVLLQAVKAGTLTTYGYLGANAAGTATANAFGLPLGQLSFPATQNASADANTLDDYEEADWTPTLQFGGASVGITYGTRVGKMTKIGRQITLSFTIILTSKGSSVGTASIGGMPENIAVASAGICAYHGNMSGLTGFVSILASSGANVLVLYTGGATGAASISNTNFSNTTELYGSVSYFV